LADVLQRVFVLSGQRIEDFPDVVHDPIVKDEGFVLHHTNFR